MAASASSSATPAENDKPVIVRVKRKASQSRLDAFWLEINGRPLKRALLDFEKLSISDSSNKVEELKSRKVFVQHVETITTSDVTVDILQSFVSNSADEVEPKGKNDIRRTFKTEKKQDQLLAKAKQQQEILSKNARFEQIWRSRKEKKEHVQDEALHELCRLYDVVRVDVEEKGGEVTVVYSDLEDCRMMSGYLPLLKEVLPCAAEEIEAHIKDSIAKGGLEYLSLFSSSSLKSLRASFILQFSHLTGVICFISFCHSENLNHWHYLELDIEKLKKQIISYSHLSYGILLALCELIKLDAEMLDSLGMADPKTALPDDYVYDYYAVRNDMDITEENASPFPLVQVDDEQYSDVPDDSEYESDDSNAENNPLNDYPDEESSDVEDDFRSRCSDDKSETESRSSCHQLEEVETACEDSIDSESLGQRDWSDGADPLSEEEDDSGGFEIYDYDDFGGEKEWR